MYHQSRYSSTLLRSHFNRKRDRFENCRSTDCLHNKSKIVFICLKEYPGSRKQYMKTNLTIQHHIKLFATLL